MNFMSLTVLLLLSFSCVALFSALFIDEHRYKVQDMPLFFFALLNKAMTVEMCDATKMSNAQKAKYIK